MNDFISVVDDTGRTSTLDLQDDGIVVIGVLPHNSVINPKSIEDAEALMDWLEDWLENNSEEMEDE